VCQRARREEYMSINFVLNNKDKIILFGLIIFYLILELLSINLGGVYCDEAMPACGALSIIIPVEPFGPYASFNFRLFKKDFPIMIVDYYSALESYILIPFFLLFGINVVALRLCPIIFEMFALIFLYILLKELFNRKIALVTLFILIINSVFLYYVKTGIHTASILHFTSILCLLLLWKWYKENKNKNKYLYFTIFLLGIGISIRMWFVWFVNTIIILSILFINKIKNTLKKNIFRYTIYGTLFFSLGIILFIIYNFKNNFATIRYIIEHFSKTRLGVNNFEYLHNLNVRLSVFSYYLNGIQTLIDEGSWKNRIIGIKEYVSINNISGLFFLYSLLWNVFSIIFKKGLFSYKRKLFITLIFILIFLQSPFTLSNLGGPHLFILYPFIQIIEALAIVESIEVFKRNKAMLTIVSCVLLIFIFKEINVTFRNNYLYFLKTGGSGNNSDAIYDLTKWLKENGYYRPVVMDWGIYHNLIFISKAKIVPMTFNYIEEATYMNAFIKKCGEILKYSDNIYIFHSKKFSNRPEVYNIFEELANKLNKNIKEIKKFYQRDGKEVFVVYSISVNR
jgi:uncharacterized membrane protein